jgi:hypothetical protein
LTLTFDFQAAGQLREYRLRDEEGRLLLCTAFRPNGTKVEEPQVEDWGPNRMKLTTGHYIQVRKVGARAGSLKTVCGSCGCNPCVGDPSLGCTNPPTILTFHHTLHLVQFWDTQADFEAAKPPMHVEDFETQWVGRHRDPGSVLLRAVERYVTVHHMSGGLLLGDHEWSDAPDVHGNLAHPSMAPFQAVKK